VSWRERITIEPGKRGGKPCIRGLRITVYDVLAYLASGMSEDEILADFPGLDREDIRAVLAFAAERERKIRGEATMRYKIALHASEEGYSVSVPGLPGCWSQGATEEEAIKNIQDAIIDYLAVVDELLQGTEIREIDVAV
jgi:uncharacterized protein (DUF433 family)/predicted RNase H-like HicB family nuclease